MAMTACAAKFVISAIWLAVNCRTSCRKTRTAPIRLFILQHRDAETRPHFSQFNCLDYLRITFLVDGKRHYVGDVKHLFGFSQTPEWMTCIWAKRRALPDITEGAWRVMCSN